MATYEFNVTKWVIGTFTVEADTEAAARDMVRDDAHRTILVNNVSPWSTEIIKEKLVDVKPTLEECPEHEGAFDCTPFCAICEGNQEYDKKVEV